MSDKAHGPEWYIREDIIGFLKTRKWIVEITHGNMFQKGFPDLYAAHPKKGKRWIDAKVPGRYSLTKAQKRKWPVWDAFGIGIWIMVAGTQEEYDKLFQPPNWRDYWRKSYGPIPTVDVNARDPFETLDVDGLLRGLNDEAQ